MQATNIQHKPKTSSTWADLLLPWRIVGNLSKTWDLLFQISRREVVGRYRGAYLGILWSFLTPLLMLAVYVLVFGFIFEGAFSTNSTSRMDFSLGLFTGLLVFNMFAECLARAPALILSNPNYVTKVVFPLEILPVSVVASAVVHFVVGMVPLCIGLLVAHGHVPIMGLLSMTLLMIPAILLSLGVTWFFSALGVFVRDILSLMTPLVTILMFMSAVFYPIEAVPVGLRPLMYANPLAVVIEQSRNVLVMGQGMNWTIYAILFAVGVVVCMVGHLVFVKLRPGFADVL